MVTQFCHLGDVLDSVGGAVRAVRARVAAVWGKWRAISRLLLNKGIPLARRGMVFDACIRSVILYGGETWALRKRLESVLVGCDRRMLRYMAGVTRRDWVYNDEEVRSEVWGGDVGGCSSEEKIGVVWTGGVEG